MLRITNNASHYWHSRDFRKENTMYINQFEVSGIPEFYAMGESGLGEFCYLGGILAYFPYPVRGGHMLRFPEGEDGELLPITAKGFLHSEEYKEAITCMDCGEEFGKQLSLTFLSVTSFRPSGLAVALGKERQPPEAGGTVLGDVYSVRTVKGRARDFYTARLAVKDATAPVGFSYVTVSSLHPFTVGKGDRLCSGGRLVTERRCLNAICPCCSRVNAVTAESVVLQASSVQSWNAARGYFGDTPDGIT